MTILKLFWNKLIPKAIFMGLKTNGHCTSSTLANLFYS